MAWETTLLTENFRQILSDEVLPWLPKLGGAFLLLIIGWIAARLIQFLIDVLLRRLHVDQLGERAGAEDFLQNLGLEPSVSGLIARLFYWLVLLVFILAAAESLGLNQVTETLQGLVGYLPHVLAAALILLLGALIARLVGNTIGALADQSGVRGGLALGQVSRYVILIFVVILTLEQLGVDTDLLVYTATALVGAVLFALAVAFGFGSRDLARHVMAGFHARDVFVIGQTVTVGEHRGKLVGIGPVKSILETGDGRLTVPNSYLLEAEVLIHAGEEKQDQGEQEKNKGKEDSREEKQDE